MSGQDRDYIASHLNPILEEMVTSLLLKRPEDPIPAMLEWIHVQMGSRAPHSDKAELIRLRQEVARMKTHQEGSEDEHSEEDEDDFEEDANPVRRATGPRAAVSAEVYGEWNKKEDFHPRVIPKSEGQRARIFERLGKSFMFSALEETEKEIVVNSMEERKVAAGNHVIKQGEDGNELLLVDTGSLKCYKNIQGQEKFLKDYHPGEAFGELALLYNAPRAATIIAETDCLLWALDRACFNHIVKDAAMRRRERYENFLSGIELLSDMDPYERGQLADALVSCSFNERDHIIREGEPGDDFFIIEEGTAIAMKVVRHGNPPQEVASYGPSGYFGELALIKNEPRAASIIATSALKCVKLDRHSFKRLLGPVESILKRNAEKYEQVMAKLIGS
jgi:cAMP-dependent protein kinase regulator